MAGAQPQARGRPVLCVRRLSSPLVNREAELATIAEFWDKAVAGHGGVVLIEGEAGIGKSRILHEVRRRTRFQRTKLLLFQCLPGNTLSTLHPLLQNVRGDLTSNEEQLSADTVAEVFGDHDVHDSEVVDVFSFLLGAAGANPELQGERPGGDPRESQLGGSPRARGALRQWTHRAGGRGHPVDRPDLQAIAGGACRARTSLSGTDNRHHPPWLRRLARRHEPRGPCIAAAQPR